MTIKMVQERVGINALVDVVRRLDIHPNLPKQLATVLGSQEATLLQMVTAFGMIANGGKKIKPIMIDRIQDRTGKTIVKASNTICKNCINKNLEPPEFIDNKEQVLDPVVAYQTVSLMQGVVHNNGTGRSIKKIYDNPSLGGKSGSTNEHKDALFIGIYPDLVVGTTVYFDDPMTLGNKESGGKVAAPIVGNFFKDALKDTPPAPFKIPPGIHLVKVDHKSGRKATEGEDIIIEAFKAGTENQTGGARSANTGSKTSDAQNDNDPQVERQDDEPVYYEQTVEVPIDGGNVVQDDTVEGTGGVY